MAYGYGSLYDDLITRAYGVSSGGNPFMSPEMSSTWSGADPTIATLLVDMVSRNLFGVNSPLRIPSWTEPRAGSLGAFAYSRFRSNHGAIGALSMQNRIAAGMAVGAALTGNEVTGLAFGTTAEDAAALQRSLIADTSGFADMGVNLFKQLFGMQDYGYAGIRAGQQRSAFLLSGMSRDANRMLSDFNPVSDSWREREVSVVGEYAKAAREAMYLTDRRGSPTFIRNENFMRGFQETDLAPILEKVAASVGQGEDLKGRIETVGGAAIKTLEAFRDLFGNAEDAKRLLNQMTAGGWGGMDAARLDSMTNQARGLMRLGEINGLGVQAVGRMLAVGQNGVSAAMGYTPADMAGGYVNQGVVTGITGRFLAQQMADLRVDGASMDPVELQRMQARALYRSTEFAGSTAGRSMMAYEMAVATGAIRGEAQQRRIRAMFRSGDPEAMARAAQLTASALGVDVDRFQDDAFYKNAADIVSRDKARMDEYADMGYAASEAEDRIRVERSYANEALDSARDMAFESGVSGKVIEETERNARLRSIREDLQRNIGSGNSEARRVLRDITTLEDRMNRGELSSQEFMGQVDKLLEFVGPGFAAMARTTANAAAAYALSDLGSGEEVSLSGLADVSAFVNSNGGNSSAFSKRDAIRYIKALAGSGGIVDKGLLARLEKIDANSSVDSIRSVLEDVERGGFAGRASGVSFNGIDYGNLAPTTAFGGELADMLGNIKVRRYWTDGGRGQIENVGQLFDTTWNAVGRLAKNYGSVDENGAFNYKDGISDEDYTALHAIFDDLKSQDPARIRAAAKRAADLLGGDVGATDAGGKKDLAFLKALSAENGEGVDYTFGAAATHLREDQLADVFRSVNAGNLDAFKSFFGQDGKVDVKGMLGRMAEMQANGGGGELAELINRIRASGTDIAVAIDSAIKPDSAFGVVGLSAITSQYGGGAVVSDTFKRALANTGEKAGWSQDRIEEVGATVQKIVNGAAEEAYTTTQQAVLRGFTLGDDESLGKLVDMFLDPSATQEQKTGFLKGVKEWFQNKKVEGDQGATLAAIATGVENGELVKVAEASGARVRGESAGGEFDAASVVERNKGTREWLPKVLAETEIRVRVVNESIAVTEAQSAPEAQA